MASGVASHDQEAMHEADKANREWNMGGAPARVVMFELEGDTNG